MDGSLYDIIKIYKKISEEEALSIVAQIIDAYLDSFLPFHIVHRDIKPKNILFKKLKDGTIKLKIADLGLAKTIR